MARSVIQVKNFEEGSVGDLLHLVHQEKPRPGPGEVLVRITLRPVNPTDLITIRTRRLPDENGSVGSEGFGIVEETGEGVTRFKPGQRVVPVLWRLYKTGQGSWQDYALLSESNVVAVPDNVSDEAAAQFLVNPWTVYGLLQDLAIPEGEYILQTAAGSVLGRSLHPQSSDALSSLRIANCTMKVLHRQLIQLAKHWGIKTINIVRRDEWKPELEALGADEVINSTTEDVVARVKEITGGKLAYAAVDAVGGVLTKTVAASVRDGGKVFIYGLLSGWDFTQSILDLRRKVQVNWWMLHDYVDTEAKQQHVATEVMKLLEQKVITPLAGKKFKLEDFKEAIEESEKEGRGGKVLLVN